MENSFKSVLKRGVIIMGVPKRKASKIRGRRRRAVVMKLTPPTLVRCPQCDALYKPHHMCLECGYYKGEEVFKSTEQLDVEEAKEA